MGIKITHLFVEHLLGMSSASITEVFTQQMQARVEARRQKEVRLRTLAATVWAKLPKRLQRVMVAAEEKGSSNWLTALPLAEHGFSLGPSTLFFAYKSRSDYWHDYRPIIRR